MRKPFVRAAFWASALFASVACSSDHATIHLKVDGASEAIVVRIEGDHSIPWDTIAIANGQLNLNLPLDSTLQTFYFLLFDTGGSLRLGIQPGDNIEGNVDARNPMTEYNVQGSILSEQLLALYRPVLRSSHLLDSLDGYRQEHHSDSTITALAREQRHFELLEARYFTHREEVQAIMAQDSSNLSNVFGFFQQVGQVPLFRPSTDLDLMQTYSAALIKAYPSHPLAQIFAQETERLAMGATSTEIR
ncbi:MAG: DUF4369 domain-containing protein [Schleiferiaceae bacterium]|nr:DUF4369 domain-containing protein [Schleiferiaceae bacterium]